MTHTSNHDSLTARHQAHGWTISACLHLCGLGGALLLMAELEHPALPQSVRLDIALVQSAARSNSAPAPASASPIQPAPSKPAPSRSPTSTGQPIERRIVEKQTVATSSRPPITRDVTRPPAHIDTQPEVIRPAPHRPAIHQAGEPVAQKAQEIPISEERQVVAQSVAGAEATLGTIASTPVSHTAVEQGQSVNRGTLIEQERTVEREEGVEQAPAIEQATAIEQSVAVHETRQSRPLPSDVEHRPVMERAMQTLPETQADYGWLAESLWKRIEELKRYPTKARARHWEGKVILEAVIQDDGTIMELRIEESSGHAILDQDALAVVRKASPLALKHPLGQPRITILVPINYSLGS